MIDTHTHIYSAVFDADRDAVVASARQSGITAMLQPNVDDTTLEALNNLCRQYPDCLPLYGLHPTDMREDYHEQLRRIFDFAEQQGNSIGVGEIGLDLYWEKEHLNEQIDALEWQINYALEHDMPMSIHCREAYPQLRDVMSHFDAAKFHASLHCFAGTADDAEYFVANYPNVMFGFNGSCTYKNSKLPDIVRRIPTDRLLIETDAPYLAPIPVRGKRNEPSNLLYIVSKLAELAQVDVETLKQLTTDNATRLFRLKPTT